MNRSDVAAHRSRSDAVFYEIATSFIAQKLDSDSEGVTPCDVVSVIEFHNEARVIFEREPMTWELYNRIVNRAGVKSAKSDGQYIPALDLAMKLLQKDDHENLAPLLLFLSDGKPSDMFLEHVRHYGLAETQQYYSKKSNREWWETLCLSKPEIFAKTKEIGMEFGDRLNFGTIGFGKSQVAKQYP